MLSKFRHMRRTGKAFLIWTLLALILLAARLPFEHWSEHCTYPLGPGVSLCTQANAPRTLSDVLILWAIGVLVIALLRYLPLPKPKR